MNPDPHTHSSSYREKLIEHLFIGEIMRQLWLREIDELEVLAPQVDSGGYDLVLEANSVSRHVQLKTSSTTSTTAETSVSVKLLAKPCACVVWINFNPADMKLGPFWWYGDIPGQRMPGLAASKVAKHVRANKEGIRGDRLGHRVLKKTRFVRVDTIDDLVGLLFGDFHLSSSTT